MSEKKDKKKRKKDEYTGPGEEEHEKPAKNEYKVAKWLKNNVKTKKTKFLGHNVEYFSANKALDALMKSKFVSGKDPLFTTREQAIDFMDVMLEHKFFHRAKKVTIEQKIKSADTEKDNKNDKTDKSKEATEGKATKDKKKRRIRLEMHNSQVFVDGSEAYVWIYDPIPMLYWVFGLILLLGAILICLFPLWPPLLRKGVYYLSVFAAGFLVFLLSLTVLRLVIFVIVYLATLTKLHFWIFPNLTEDVGFFESFWPLYESKYETELKESKSKKKKKCKDSDAEDNDDIASSPLEPAIIENVKEHDDDLLQRSNDDNSEKQESAKQKYTSSNTESESEESRSSAGRDFELIDSNEVET